MSSDVDYTLVPCNHCGAQHFQECVKVRGGHKGEPASQFHAVRGYAYWAQRRKGIKP